MKVFNRFPIIKRFLFSIGFSFLTMTLCSMFLKFAFLPVPLNVSYLGDGDTIEVTGPETIEITIYSEDSTGLTSILDGDTIIITTEPGVKSGYYDAEGFIRPGVYQVSGDSAYLELQEGSQIANGDMVARTKDINKKLLDFTFFISFLLYFAMAPQMINLKKAEETQPPN